MLTIYTSRYAQPEKEYVFHVLFREILGAEYRVIDHLEAHQHRIVLPNGAEVVVENHCWFPDIQSIPPAPGSIEGLAPHPFHPGEDLVVIYGRPVFSIDEHRITCGIDLFASIFYMLTRWEENNPSVLDAFGRFPAQASLAFRANFLHRPVVNEWAALLWQMLLRLGWKQPLPTRSFNMALSCDVDHPKLWWATRDRLRTIGGALLKRKSLKEALYWTQNHLFHSKDPYDVFDEWMDIFEANNCVAQFNFLGARPRKSDCWYPLEHPFIRTTLEKIAARGHRIGFHPSWEAFDSLDVFKQELASLQAISPRIITHGRQHYLRFKAPDTWRMWQAAGLSGDSTLGYPEAIGFRCGICHDFPVYDASEQKMLLLRETPLLAMDVTLAQYCHNTPTEAGQQLEALKAQVKKYNGDFTLLWHNSSWNTYQWDPWKHVLLDVIR